MKKIFTLFAALVCGLALNAATVYCKMTHEWWTKDGAAVAAHDSCFWRGKRMVY